MILQRCAHPRPCYDDGKCHYKGECGHKAPLTNADRIRAMSDKELAEFIKNIKARAVFCKAVKNNDAFEKLCSAEWLKQPVDDDENGVQSKKTATSNIRYGRTVNNMLKIIFPMLMVIGAMGSLVVNVISKGEWATSLQWIGAGLLYTALMFRNMG